MVPMNKGKLWRLLGLGGVVGVAATGAIIARDQRRRAQLTPDEVRDRLHQRLGESDSTGAGREEGPARIRRSRRRCRTKPR